MPFTFSLSKSSPATVSVPAATDGKAVAPPTPSEADKDASLSSSLTSLFPQKERRAYEYGRQRVKKAEDLAKRRAQRSTLKHPAAAAKGSEKTAKPVVNGVKSEDEANVNSLSFSLPPSPEVPTTERLGAGSPRVEVKLSDLITTKDTRSRKRRDSDFEFVPHIRSVIVLDDFSASDISAVDEPWEHVDAEGDKADSLVPPLSYAQVVAK